MNKWYVALSLAAALLTMSPLAEAKKSSPANIDFGSYTCKGFMQEIASSSEEDTGAVLLWLDGYLSGVTGDTELNWQGFEDFTEKLVQRCQSHANENLLDAAQKVGIE